MPRSTHGFGPVYDGSSRILILGSFPSVKSREDGFYYAHPRNRFWPLLARLLGEPEPATVEEKKRLVLSHGIALWDVAESCEVRGSGDNTIREVTPVAIRELLAAAPIEQVCCNGATAWALYMEYLYPITELPAVKLPSTSPANAQCTLEVLERKWRAAMEAGPKKPSADPFGADDSCAPADPFGDPEYAPRARRKTARDADSWTEPC